MLEGQGELDTAYMESAGIHAPSFSMAYCHRLLASG